MKKINIRKKKSHFFKDKKLFTMGAEMNPLRAVVTVATFIHLKV